MLTSKVRAESPQSKRQSPTYSAIPHELIEDRRLTGTDVRLAGIILKYARAKAEAWPAVKTLAGDLGRCERTVQYSLKRLAQAGWIISRPAPNPTGRVLVLVWRQLPCTPPVQPYSQGLPRKTVAPEAKNPPLGGEVKATAPPGGRNTTTHRRVPERPLVASEVLGMYAEAGWLSLAPGHPLRRIAERRVARVLDHPGGAADRVRADNRRDQHDRNNHDVNIAMRT